MQLARNIPEYSMAQRGVMGGVMRGANNFRAVIGAPPSGDGSLQDVVASCVFDLDATIIDSYDGSSQTWANLVTAPADGAAQTDYDYYRGSASGSETNDPSFVGTAGDSGAYFTTDSSGGIDVFTLVSGANTDFLRDMHKTTGGSDFWFAVALQPLSSASAQTIASTQTSTLTTGLRFAFSTTEELQLIQRGSTNSIGSSGLTFTTATDYLMIFSHSHSGNQTRVWMNSTTAVEFSQTFDTTTTDPANDLVLLANGSSARLAATTRIYGVSMGNEYLDDTKVAAIFSEYNTRHGRTYA